MGMETISYNQETQEYTTDLGIFTFVKSMGYNKFEYHVKKVSGVWPTKDELGGWLNHYYNYFGGTVTIGETTAYALIYGAD